jgi:outer membrane biosynthesis protein TonB
MSLTTRPTRVLFPLFAGIILCNLASWPMPAAAAGEEVYAPPFIPKGIVWPQAGVTTQQAQTAQPEQAPPEAPVAQPEAGTAPAEAPAPPAETAPQAETTPPVEPAAQAKAAPPAEPAAQAKAAPPAEPAAQAEAVTPPAETPATKPATTVDDATHHHRGGYHDRQDRLREQREAQFKAMRENRERWNSMRRWWINPRAEERRQWNRARSQYYRDMAEARSRYYDQYRERYHDHGGGYPYNY